MNFKPFYIKGLTKEQQARVIDLAIKAGANPYEGVEGLQEQERFDSLYRENYNYVGVDWDNDTVLSSGSDIYSDGSDRAVEISLDELEAHLELENTKEQDKPETIKFGAWAKTECSCCDNEFQVTRTSPKEFEKLEDIICGDCEEFQSGEKAGRYEALAPITRYLKYNWDYDPSSDEDVLQCVTRLLEASRTKVENDNTNAPEDWYDYNSMEAIEVPPVGTRCLVNYNTEWFPTEILGTHRDIIFDSSDFSEECYDGYGSSNIHCFRPLDWDKNKEKVVDLLPLAETGIDLVFFDGEDYSTVSSLGEVSKDGFDTSNRQTDDVDDLWPSVKLRLSKPLVLNEVQLMEIPKGVEYEVSSIMDMPNLFVVTFKGLEQGYVWPNKGNVHKILK